MSGSATVLTVFRCLYFSERPFDFERQTFAKWPLFPQFSHVLPYAGHDSLPLGSPCPEDFTKCRLRCWSEISVRVYPRSTALRLLAGTIAKLDILGFHLKEHHVVRRVD